MSTWGVKQQGAAGLASVLALYDDTTYIAFLLFVPQHFPWLSRLINMTTISRFAVVSTISLSILASICIATTQPYIIYPARNISQTESEGLSHVINAISEKWYDYTRWEKTIPEFWVAWLNTAAYESFRSDLRVNKMPFLERTLLI